MPLVMPPPALRDPLDEPRISMKLGDLKGRAAGVIGGVEVGAMFGNRIRRRWFIRAPSAAPP